MTNGTLTLDMLYTPNFVQVYDIVHHCIFFLTTIFTILISYIILKKSTEAMGFYKYILLNAIVWNYAQELQFYLWNPINLEPYFLFYSHGLLNNFLPNGFLYIFYSFMVVCAGTANGMIIAILYRTSQLFPHTRFHRVFNDRKNFLITYVMLLLGTEIVFAIPFSPFFINPYNNTMALNSIIEMEPIYSKITLLEPTTAGCDFQNYCRLTTTLAFILFLAIGIPGLIFAITIFGLYVRKLYTMKKTFSKKTYQLNIMLFRALVVQILIIVLCPGFSISMLIIMPVFKFPLSIAGQLMMIVAETYPILEISCLCYFITPYRIFISHIITAVAAKMGLIKSPQSSNIQYLNQMSNVYKSGLSRMYPVKE